MKKLLLLPVFWLLSLSLKAQSDGGLTINLKGDSNTEQAAKLELIRILQERTNKLTVSQLNSRIIVSRGVTNYYKVDEIIQMNQEIWAYRSKYVGVAQKMETGTSGFSANSGNSFTYKYIVQLNSAVEKAGILKKQLDVVTKSGQPIVLPALPSFSISAASGNPAEEMAMAMKGLMESYGVSSQEEFDALPQSKKDELKAKGDELINQFKGALEQQMKDSNKKTLTLVGNIVGTAFGVPGAGTLVAGLVSGSPAAALAGLVGNIVDNFQIPVDYYDSNTLKLTDSERIHIIDELHMRMSELYQQVTALGASLSSETKARYGELSAPRNETIMYGPKK